MDFRNNLILRQKVRQKSNLKCEIYVYIHTTHTTVRPSSVGLFAATSFILKNVVQIHWSLLQVCHERELCRDRQSTKLKKGKDEKKENKTCFKFKCCSVPSKMCAVVLVRSTNMKSSNIFNMFCTLTLPAQFLTSTRDQCNGSNRKNDRTFYFKWYCCFMLTLQWVQNSVTFVWCFIPWCWWAEEFESVHSFQVMLKGPLKTARSSSYPIHLPHNYCNCQLIGSNIYLLISTFPLSWLLFFFLRTITFYLINITFCLIMTYHSSFLFLQYDIHGLP